MKKFFKENSYLIVKLVVYQLGVMIMGITVSFATAGVEATWLYPAASLFCVLFYLFLIYLVGYDNGQKDGIKIESGKITARPFRFFLVGLVANSLNLLFGLIVTVVRLALDMPFSGELLGSYTPEWLVSLQDILLLIARITQMMYHGIIERWCGGNVALFLVVPLPAILVAGISYLIGVKYKNGFLPKNKNDSETKRYS